MTRGQAHYRATKHFALIRLGIRDFVPVGVLDEYVASLRDELMAVQAETADLCDRSVHHLECSNAIRRAFPEAFAEERP